MSDCIFQSSFLPNRLRSSREETQQQQRLEEVSDPRDKKLIEEIDLSSAPEEEEEDSSTLPLLQSTWSQQGPKAASHDIYAAPAFTHAQYPTERPFGLAQHMSPYLEARHKAQQAQQTQQARQAHFAQHQATQAQFRFEELGAGRKTQLLRQSFHPAGAKMSNASCSPAMTDLDFDPENELKIELSDGSTSHLFRHASEITRETKGGYLQGRVRLPRDIVQGSRPVFFRLSLVPAQIDGENNPFHLHPNLLHINMRTNKKTRKLQDGELPDDVDWHFVFKIQDDDVFRVCPPSNPALRSKRFHRGIGGVGSRAADDSGLAAFGVQADSGGGGQMGRVAEEAAKSRFMTKLQASQNATAYLDLGLMLNIITPLQKFSKGGTTISDVVRQRFQDLFTREISADSLTQVEEVFTKKKEDRIKLQQVRLLLEIFNPDDLSFQTSCLSEVVTNSKSKECGPLQLHDVNPAVSCCESETKIFILSFFKLVADVRANFILYNPEQKTVVYDQHHDLMARIRQPSNCSVFNQTVLVFKAPKQDYEVIRKIRHLRLQLRLAAFRPSDKKMSSNSFEFIYLEHGNCLQDGLRSTCDFCVLLKNPSQYHHEELPIAKPGVQRRVAHLMEQPDYVRDESEQHDIMVATATGMTVQSKTLTNKSSTLETTLHHQGAVLPRLPTLTPRPTAVLMEQPPMRVTMHSALPEAGATTAHLHDIGKSPPQLMASMTSNLMLRSVGGYGRSQMAVGFGGQAVSSHLEGGSYIPTVVRPPSMASRVLTSRSREEMESSTKYTIKQNDVVEMKIEPDAILVNAYDDIGEEPRSKKPALSFTDNVVENSKNSVAAKTRSSSIKEETSDIIEDKEEEHITLPIPPMKYSGSLNTKSIPKLPKAVLLQPRSPSNTLGIKNGAEHQMQKEQQLASKQ